MVFNVLEYFKNLSKKRRKKASFLGWHWIRIIFHYWSFFWNSSDPRWGQRGGPIGPRVGPRGPQGPRGGAHGGPIGGPRCGH